MCTLRRALARILVVLAALALLVTGTVVAGTAADAAAPRYVRMSVTEYSYARAVLAELNRERTANHRKPLRFSLTLSRSAAAHNRTMAAANVISHQVPGERDFVRRDRRAGWKPRCALGENLGVSADLSRAGAMQLQTLMYGEVAPNDGHRQNILNTRYSHAGVAVMLDRVNDRLWLTVDFGQRRC